MIDKSGSPVGAPFLFGEQESLEGLLEEMKRLSLGLGQFFSYKYVILNDAIVAKEDVQRIRWY